MIRPFRLRDFFTLNRYRNQGLFLDSIPTLTWGRALVPAGALLSSLSPLTGVFTSMCFLEGNRARPLVAQAVHFSGSSFARFTFLAPDSALESPAATPLLENLIKRVGARGAHSLIAEVDEQSHAFEALRSVGFSIYSRQRIWRLTEPPEASDGESGWRRPNARDEINVRSLYNALVPAMVQQVEPAPLGRLRGMVNYVEGELLAFVDLAQGPRGVWIQPFVHPETDQVRLCMERLLVEIPPRKSRPLYVCVRSYQSWLENAIEDLGGEPGPRQAVMVKRTALTQKVAESYRLPAVEGGTAEITTPINTGNDSAVISYKKQKSNV